MQCPCRVSYGVSVCAGVSSLRCTFVVVLFTAVRYALEALYVGEVVEYKQLFEIQVGVKQVSLGCCCCFVATGG